MTSIGPFTRTIYGVLILILVMLTVTVPFLSIDIHTSAPSVIRPAAEVSVIRAPVGGIVDSILIQDNEPVKKNQLLFIINHSALDLAMASVGDQMAETKRVVQDLRLALATANQHAKSPSFQTASIRQSFRTYRENWSRAADQLKKSQRLFQRQQVLFESKVIAAQEFEQYQFEYLQDRHHLAALEEESRNVWENDLRREDAQFRELEHQLNKLNWQQSQHYVYAPVSGSLQLSKALYRGVFVSDQEELLRLSPDTVLQVLALVPVNSIAIVETGMPMTIQVDAYPHQVWGLVSGHVVSIAQESKQLGNAWIFEVRCSLNQSYTRHSNGARGQLRKGMTGMAHFQRGTITLWRLVFMKVDDALNPYADKLN